MANRKVKMSTDELEARAKQMLQAAKRLVQKDHTRYAYDPRAEIAVFKEMLAGTAHDPIAEIGKYLQLGAGDVGPVVIDATMISTMLGTVEAMLYNYSNERGTDDSRSNELILRCLSTGKFSTLFRHQKEMDLLCEALQYHEREGWLIQQFFHMILFMIAYQEVLVSEDRNIPITQNVAVVRDPEWPL